MPSITKSEAKPNMAALPLSISASGVKKANASRLVEERRGMREATVKVMKVKMMAVGASANWRRTDSPVESSAPMAATTASMASRPLTSSGAGPLKAMRSPMDIAFAAGVGMGAAGAGLEMMGSATACLNCRRRMGNKKKSEFFGSKRSQSHRN